MYSRKVIEKNILRAESLIRESEGLSARWSMRPATIGERQEMTSHFESLLDDRGFLTRDFTKEERLWILVESTICKLDFIYFARNYAKIEDWSAQITYFNPNLAQQIILDMMAEYEELGWALMFMFLKARQLGITTLFQVVLAHRIFFWRNVGAYTGSAEEKKSRAMVGKLEFLWKNTPWWLRPRRTAFQAGDFMKFEDINSSLWVQWGNQTQGIGRGATPTIAHLSELSTFEHPEQLVDASLYRAMHENPFAMLALESTANGIGNWWYRTWYLMSKMDAQGLANYKPVFLPWYVGVELYPTVGDLKRRPVPENWVAPQYVDRHAEAAKAYVESNSYLKKALGANWELPLSQRWYYYLQYETAREMRGLHTLLQELPANADEAFQNTNPSVFSIDTLSTVRMESTAAVPVGVFQVAGDQIPFIYSDQRVVGQSVPVQCFGPSMEVLESFELQPVEMDGWPDNSSDLKLYIWEGPRMGETYGIYCDPSEGVERDSSVVGVIKKATPFHPDEQVAEWASNKVGPHDLWAYVYCLAHLYTVRDYTGEWREPLVVIETNVIGDGTQNEMKNRGYSHFYRVADMTMVGDVGAEFKKRPRAIKDRIGWRTDRNNRPKMLSLFRKMVRDGTLKIRSPYLVREMATLEFNIDKQRIQAATDQHDDRVIGPAMLLCAWYDPEVYGNVPMAYQELRAYEADLEKMPAYMGNVELGRSTRFIEIPRDTRDSRTLYDY